MCTGRLVREEYVIGVLDLDSRKCKILIFTRLCVENLASNLTHFIERSVKGCDTIVEIHSKYSQRD